MPELQLLEASGNNFNSRLPNVSLKANASFALFNINMFYGSVTFVITSSVLSICRAIISEVGYQIMHRGRHLLVSIAYRMCQVRGVQEIRMCIIYSERVFYPAVLKLPAEPARAAVPPRRVLAPRLIVYASARMALAWPYSCSHSGDLFRCILEGWIPIVIRKIDLQSSVKKESYTLEMDLFGKVSHSRLVPLLGHRLENEQEKFLVYKYMPNGDLLSSLFKKMDSDDNSLQKTENCNRGCQGSDLPTPRVHLPMFTGFCKPFAFYYNFLDILLSPV
ncbi:probable LRR receptor-like serine threonine-kinase At2g16250 [Olea europaea subsp. europaea]|uniref:Probable LRR receptor-like serine threonine-kinase At2g16250 n=1 Tax=Olea europaea subsp. europaea TaxID=158383 RepID=A0A8S0SDD1_OLEEU|nr:probable LRR receptor-like serine threonine-kinase At2g16250 [Olea europaea subsp. europaea]